MVFSEIRLGKSGDDFEIYFVLEQFRFKLGEELRLVVCCDFLL